jgi:hypothetical protein
MFHILTVYGLKKIAGLPFSKGMAISLLVRKTLLLALLAGLQPVEVVHDCAWLGSQGDPTVHLLYCFSSCSFISLFHNHCYFLFLAPLCIEMSQAPSS